MKYLLFVVTGTLMLLSSSCVELYTSLVVFAASIITTYICYTLQTQLKLDKVIKALCNFRKKGKKIFFFTSCWKDRHVRFLAPPQKIQCYNKKSNDPFVWIVLNHLKAQELLQLIIKLISHEFLVATHLNHLSTNHWVNLGPTQWLWTRNPRSENQMS